MRISSQVFPLNWEALVEKPASGKIVNVLCLLFYCLIYLIFALSASFCVFYPHFVQHLAEQVEVAEKGRSIEL